MTVATLAIIRHTKTRFIRPETLGSGPSLSNKWQAFLRNPEYLDMDNPGYWVISLQEANLTRFNPVLRI
jgi:hypothetical protein